MSVETDRIDAEVAVHRRLCLLADEAGHEGEYLWHEKRIDDLIDERLRLRGEEDSA